MVSGSSGIGPGAALAPAAAGAKVVVAARREAECRELVDEVKARGGEAAFARVDVLIPDRREGRARWGRLDCAVNSACINEDVTPLAGADDAVFERMTAVR
ncbi:SDR family NAD(P)-dependent oxidoreductase [Sorangium sp. So ce269]